MRRHPWLRHDNTLRFSTLCLKSQFNRDLAVRSYVWPLFKLDTWPRLCNEGISQSLENRNQIYYFGTDRRSCLSLPLSFWQLPTQEEIAWLYIGDIDETRPIPGFNAIPIKCSRNFSGKVLLEFGGIGELGELLGRVSGLGKIMFLECFDCRTCFRFQENGLTGTYFLRQTFTKPCDGNIASFLSYFLLQSVDDVL